jgi:hypothetical protein
MEFLAGHNFQRKNATDASVVTDNITRTNTGIEIGVTVAIAADFKKSDKLSQIWTHKPSGKIELYRSFPAAAQSPPNTARKT